MTQIKNGKWNRVQNVIDTMNPKYRAFLFVGMLVMLALFTLTPNTRPSKAELNHYLLRSDWMEAVVVALAENKTQNIDQEGGIWFTGAAKGKSFIVNVQDHNVILYPGTKYNQALEDGPGESQE